MCQFGSKGVWREGAREEVKDMQLQFSEGDLNVGRQLDVVLDMGRHSAVVETTVPLISPQVGVILDCGGLSVSRVSGLEAGSQFGALGATVDLNKNGCLLDGSGVFGTTQCFGDLAIPSSNSALELDVVSPLVTGSCANEIQSNKLKICENNSNAARLDHQQVGVEADVLPPELATFPNFSEETVLELVVRDIMDNEKALAAVSTDGTGPVFQSHQRLEHLGRIDLENKELEVFDHHVLGGQQQANSSQILGMESLIFSCNSESPRHDNRMLLRNQQEDDDNLSPHWHHSENSFENQEYTAAFEDEGDDYLEDWKVQKRKGREIEHMDSKVSKRIELPKTKRFTRSSLKEVGGKQLFLQWHGNEEKMDEVIDLIDRVLDDKGRLEELRRQRENAAVVKEDEKKKKEMKKSVAVAKAQDKLTGKQKQGRHRRKG